MSLWIKPRNCELNGSLLSGVLTRLRLVSSDTHTRVHDGSQCCHGGAGKVSGPLPAQEQHEPDPEEGRRTRTGWQDAGSRGGAVPSRAAQTVGL